MKKTSIGFAMTGSFCTFERVLKQMEALVRRGYEVLPVLSFNAGTLDTRFMTAEHLRARIVEITGNEPIDTLAGAEPIGPKKLLDLLIICPCTGNTLGKLAAGITDTSVTMAAKAHLRNCRPILLAPSTNDGLAASARNLGQLMSRKYIYLVPFRQDDPEEKPASLVADFSLVADAAQAALEGRQLQPVLLGPAAP